MQLVKKMIILNGLTNSANAVIKIEKTNNDVVAKANFYTVFKDNMYLGVKTKKNPLKIYPINSNNSVITLENDLSFDDVIECIVVDLGKMTPLYYGATNAQRPVYANLLDGFQNYKTAEKIEIKESPEMNKENKSEQENKETEKAKENIKEKEIENKEPKSSKTVKVNATPIIKEDKSIPTDTVIEEEEESQEEEQNITPDPIIERPMRERTRNPETHTIQVMEQIPINQNTVLNKRIMREKMPENSENTEHNSMKDNDLNQNIAQNESDNNIKQDTAAQNIQKENNTEQNTKKENIINQNKAQNIQKENNAKKNMNSLNPNEEINDIQTMAIKNKIEKEEIKKSVSPDMPFDNRPITPIELKTEEFEKTENIKQPEMKKEEKIYSQKECNIANKIGEENKIGENKNFYGSIENKLNELMKNNPKEEILTTLIQGSKWAKVNIDTDNSYVVGILTEDNKPTYVCYGIEGSKNIVPTDCKDYQWIPVVPDESKGYWIIFQDASTGKVIKES